MADNNAFGVSNPGQNKAIHAKGLKGMSSKETLGYSPVKRDKAFIKRMQEQNPDFHK